MAIASTLKAFKACAIILSLCAAPVVDAQSYKEPYRPQYHFTPAKNWMNDPNGLIYHKGVFHMYYQHNPTGDVWGNMSWGHASSKDLMHWDEQPVALSAFEAPVGSLKEFYFSGSTVSDPGRTSGWGTWAKPPLVAAYTSLYTQEMALPNGKHVRENQQAQSIAYSLDDGQTWSEYEGNPVIAEPPPQYADQWKDFRDPFVFWHGPQSKWVMVLALAAKHKALIYESRNLKDWKLISEFGPVNAIGGVWECPSLTQYYVDGKQSNPKWLLMLGLNPGGPFPAGSGTQYLVGSFDGTNFVADAETIHDPATAVVNSTIFPQANWADWGPDYYAAVPWNGLPTNKHIAIGWMNDWAYATSTPTAPWRSAMSIPRSLALKTIRGAIKLVQQPHPLFDTLERGKPLFQKTWNKLSSGDATLPFTAKTFDLELSFKPGKKSSKLGLDVRSGNDGARTRIGYNFKSAEMWVDRTASGNSSFSNVFANVYYAPLVADRNGEVKLRVLLDWSSVEVFGGQGESTITAQIFPAEKDVAVKLFSEGDAVDVKIKAVGVQSAWE